MGFFIVKYFEKIYISLTLAFSVQQLSGAVVKNMAKYKIKLGSSEAFKKHARRVMIRLTKGFSCLTPLTIILIL